MQMIEKKRLREREVIESQTFDKKAQVLQAREKQKLEKEKQAKKQNLNEKQVREGQMASIQQKKMYEKIQAKEYEMSQKNQIEADLSKDQEMERQKKLKYKKECESQMKQNMQAREHQKMIEREEQKKPASGMPLMDRMFEKKEHESYQRAKINEMQVKQISKKMQVEQDRVKKVKGYEHPGANVNQRVRSDYMREENMKKKKKDELLENKMYLEIQMKEKQRQANFDRMLDLQGAELKPDEQALILEKKAKMRKEHQAQLKEQILEQKADTKSKMIEKEEKRINQAILHKIDTSPLKS